MLRLIFTLVLPLLILAGCAAMPEMDKEKAPLVLKPASYSDLPGWKSDDQSQTLVAFARSCARILKQDPAKPFGPDGVGGVMGDWHAPCRALPETRDAAAARAFFEQWFEPWQATAAGTDAEGLFTGYYEASLRGSRTRHGPYQTPLHLRPADLVMVDLGEFRTELQGQRIAGRVVAGQLKPYEDRAAIVGGALKDEEKITFIWVDDPVDAFFLQIQGSGRIILEDGSTLRAGYAAQNGHPYYAIGRELIKRGALTKEQVSMQSIRGWLQAHPDQAADLMNTNKSYVFFEELKGDGPLGGEAVALTAGRSIAIDRARLPYGVPLWLEAEAPMPGDVPLRRLMMAQDTGGAIRGPVRGDVFWGYGDAAEERAGLMKSKGRYWLLLPRG